MKIELGLPPLNPFSQETGIKNSRGVSTSAAETVGLAGSSSSALDGDTTHISHAAVSAAASSSLSEVHSEKIAAIQQSLANGSYSVSASAVAGKLIDHLIEE